MSKDNLESLAFSKGSDECQRMQQDVSSQCSNCGQEFHGKHEPGNQTGAFGGHFEDCECSSKKQGAQQPRKYRNACCCGEIINCTVKIPQTLKCGHVLCIQCIERPTDSPKIPCLECPVKPDSANTDISGKKGTSVNHDNGSCTNKSGTEYSPSLEQGFSTPVVTVGGSSKGKGRKSLANSSTSQHALPANYHDSQCLDLGIQCTSYCIKCKLWLCDKCASFDHNTKRCSIIPRKDALMDMKQQSESTVKATADSLRSSVKELERYSSQLEATSMLMRAAYENMEKKQKLLNAYIQDGTQKVEKLEGECAKYPDAKYLPEALAMFREIDSQSTEAQSWISEKAKGAQNTGRIKLVLKEILYMTFECLQSLKVESGMHNQIYVFKELPTGKILSALKADGGRICIQSLTPTKNINEGSRMLPLEYIMSCMDCNSRLAFFDLSWGGHQQGRVYVRLTGDTQRGRQFVKLCTGETGPCFRGTHFHRVWWKGLPGEHVWGGDYEKSDGSGGQGLPEDNNNCQTPVDPGRKVPVTAGLVAGRYEKDKISSIFRIYTKGAGNVMEEAAFGQVEFGLNIIEKTMKLSNITDVTIDDCGIVVEV